MNPSLRRRPLFLVLTVALLFATSALSAEAYRVKLHNGNVFETAYRPIPAEFDSSKLLLMTDQGNLIAISEEDIAEIVHDLEISGFGRVIDAVTIEVGWTANLNPTAAEGQEGEMPLQMQMLQQMQQMLQPLPTPVFNTPQFSEPNAGGGIPVGFVGVTTPPMSGPQPINN